MASSVHTVEVKGSEAAIWSFIKEKGEWAVLIPGYLHHEFETASNMIWVFKGDFGFIEKAVKLKLTEKEVVEHKKLTFQLEGLSDNINGSGYFEMEEIAPDTYKISGNLDMKAGGFLAAMINPVLEKFVPETVEKLVNAMGQAITKETV